MGSSWVSVLDFTHPPWRPLNRGPETRRVREGLARLGCLQSPSAFQGRAAIGVRYDRESPEGAIPLDKGHGSQLQTQDLLVVGDAFVSFQSLWGRPLV